MKRIIHWDYDLHEESECWICPSCDAELHIDGVGEWCPVCGCEARSDEELLAELEFERDNKH